MSNTVQKIDVTFLVIAYNEEILLERTVEGLISYFRCKNIIAPILILNDGSSDGTKEIADNLVQKYEEVEDFHHPKNVGQILNIMKGVELCQTTFFSVVPGDNQFVIDSFDIFLPFIGKFDIIFGFPNNEFEARGRKRTILSHFWRLYLLGLYGISVTYLAGWVIAPKQLVEKIPFYSGGFLGWYEIATKIIISGATYIQVPFTLRDRDWGESKAFKPMRNVGDLFRMLLVWKKIKAPGILKEGPDNKKLRAIYKEFKLKH